MSTSIYKEEPGAESEELTPVEEAATSSYSTVHSNLAATPFADPVLLLPPLPAGDKRVQVHVRLRPFLKEEQDKLSSVESCCPEAKQITGTGNCTQWCSNKGLRQEDVHV